jgi:hypothetical protein
MMSLSIGISPIGINQAQLWSSTNILSNFHQMQRGEVNGVCGLTAVALRREYLPDLASGRLKLMLQINDKPTFGFGKGSPRPRLRE